MLKIKRTSFILVPLATLALAIAVFLFANFTKSWIALFNKEVIEDFVLVFLGGALVSALLHSATSKIEEDSIEVESKEK